jgi:hypothetical protein
MRPNVKAYRASPTALVEARSLCRAGSRATASSTAAAKADP